MEPLVFKPIPFVTVWGGDAIKNYYGYDWMPEHTGQAWAFSAQESNSNVCQNGRYAGMSLRELWGEQPQLFGNTNREFPLIVSMLCPCADLSIQVHPDELHAMAAGFPYGKNEAWYFLEASDDANIVFGHNAKDESDLRSYVDEGRWSELLRHLKVRKDDFVYVEAGTLHACCANVIAYEVQQSTDVTYRFYDYDRADSEGNRRPLNLEQAIGTLHYGSECNIERYKTEVVASGGCVRTTYVDSPSFKIEKLVVDDDTYELSGDTYELLSVVRGSGTIGGIDVGLGAHLLAPRGEITEISGSLTCMMTTA